MTFFAETMRTEIQAVQPVLAVRDVDASIAFYAELGFELAFRSDPAYAGVRRGVIELHLQWHDPEEWSYPVDRPALRFVVPEVDALFAEYSSLPITEDLRSVFDTAWGTREFHVRDPDGNVLMFYRDGSP